MALWWLCITGSGETRNFGFLKIRFDLEGQGQSSYKTIGILTHVFCTSDSNLVTLAWIGDEL